MTDIHIPPAALEAGAKALCGTDGAYCQKACFTCTSFARAAFTAMVEAWPGTNAKADTDHVMLLNSTPALILPLAEKTDG